MNVTKEFQVEVGRLNTALYNTPLFTDLQGIIHYAYIDPNGNLMYYNKSPEGQGGTLSLGPVIDSAYHVAPSIGVDQHGIVHIFANMHPGWKSDRAGLRDWQYWQSKYRGDALAGFRKMPTDALPGRQITYPKVGVSRGGVLYVAFREAGVLDAPFHQRQWSAGVNRLNASGEWNRLGNGPIAQDPDYAPLGATVGFDSDDDPMVSFIWGRHYTADEGSEPWRSNPVKPAVLPSAMGGTLWFNADYDKIALPAMRNDCPIITDLKPNSKGQHALPYTELCGDAHDNIYAFFFGASRRVFVRLATGHTDWVTRFMPWGATRLLVDKPGILTAVSSGIRLHRSSDRGDSWKHYGVDGAPGGHHYQVDHAFHNWTGNVRVAAQKNGISTIYTCRFHDDPPLSVALPAPTEAPIEDQQERIDELEGLLTEMGDDMKRWATTIEELLK